MARGSSKKSLKGPKTTLGTDVGPTESTALLQSPPLPFEPAPAVLLPLTKTLPRDHVFVIHPEQTSPSLRRQSFVVPVLLNLIITAGLCWRIYYALPTYLEQLITILGYETRWTVHTKEVGWGGAMHVLGERTILLSIDYVLFGLLGRWPWEFLFGDKYNRYMGCAAWKWYVGFNRPKEVVVRRGRKWDIPIFKDEEERKKQDKLEKSWMKEEELAVHTKCSDALRKTQTTKNALSLLDRDWDLDYNAMVDATELVDEAKLSFNEIDHLVLVPWQGKWFSWYPHKVKNSNGTVEPIQEKDDQLETFKGCLIDLNCEDVFYRWIEIIQYEMARPGGFTQARRNEAEQELRRMLKSRKQDDEAFWTAVGGLHGVPGLSTRG